jgi:hypothetical protein
VQGKGGEVIPLREDGEKNQLREKDEDGQESLDKNKLLLIEVAV